MHISPYTLPWPQKKATKHAIYPIFIPFAGCAQRCIFCAQHLQSGRGMCLDSPTTQSVLTEAAHHLAQRQKQGKAPMELAFYGGTFTALPEADFTACLNFTLHQQQLGHALGARCSTRPDALNPARLDALQQTGFHTVELGIQSFHDPALLQAQRHYNGCTALEACTTIKARGFSLGVQLMPGMPGLTPESFLHDTQLALNHGADFLRMYPCQVIAGTELEDMWRQGHYIPWTLEQTIESLSVGWLQAHLAEVPVIRMGLAPEASLERHLLAGPRHAALGNLVQGYALYSYIAAQLQSLSQHDALNTRPTLSQAIFPKACQGYFWGHEHSLAPQWFQLGLDKANVRWHNVYDIILFL